VTAVIGHRGGKTLHKEGDNVVRKVEQCMDRGGGSVTLADRWNMHGMSTGWGDRVSAHSYRM